MTVAVPFSWSPGGSGTLAMALWFWWEGMGVAGEVISKESDLV